MPDAMMTKDLKTPKFRIRENKNEDFKELSDSIAEHGILEPLLIKPDGEIVCGERRWNAAKKLELETVPVEILRATSDDKAFEISLIENIQRENLTPEEEAKAFAHYLRDKKWGDTTRLATKIGKTTKYVYRRLRLLNITEESLTNEKTRTDCPTLAEKKTTITHNTSSTHRLEIGRIHDPKTQRRIMKEIADHALSTKQTAQTVSMIKDGTSIEEAIKKVCTCPSCKKEVAKLIPIKVCVKCKQKILRLT